MKIKKGRCCPCEFFTNSLIQTERTKVRVWLILSSDLIIIHVQPSFIRFLRPGNQRRHFYIFLEPPLSCCGTHFPITTKKKHFLLPPKILTYLTYLQNRSITYLFWWIVEHKVLISHHALNWDANNLKNKKKIMKNIFHIGNFNIFFRTLTKIYMRNIVQVWCLIGWVHWQKYQTEVWLTVEVLKVSIWNFEKSKFLLRKHHAV